MNLLIIKQALQLLHNYHRDASIWKKEEQLGDDFVLKEQIKLIANNFKTGKVD